MLFHKKECHTHNDRLVFRRVVKSKDFQSALPNINCSFQNIMFCIIRSHSLSIWPFSLWSDVVKSVGSRSNEQKWCPPTEHWMARVTLHSPSPAGQRSCFPAALSHLSSLWLFHGHELEQWWLLLPVAGWQWEQPALGCNYPLPTHSSRSSVISLMTAFLQLEVTVMEGMGPCESHKLFYISNLANTSDHQTIESVSSYFQYGRKM